MRKRTLCCVVVVAAAVAAMDGAQAQPLADPTRPATAVADSLDASQVAPATQLQSVLISSRRRLAVINGTTVPLGGMFGEARLVKISETEVVLEKGSETEVLKMFPEVDKLATKRGAARARGGASAEKSSRIGGAK